MKHSTFFWFILPSLSLMILFIALPIVSVVIQSLHVEHEQVLVISKAVIPSDVKETTSLDQEAMEKVERRESPRSIQWTRYLHQPFSFCSGRSQQSLASLDQLWGILATGAKFAVLQGTYFYHHLHHRCHTFCVVLRLSGCSRGQQSPENIEGPYDLCLTPANDRDPPCGIIDPILDGGRGWYYRSNFATYLQ